MTSFQFGPSAPTSSRPPTAPSRTPATSAPFESLKAPGSSGVDREHPLLARVAAKLEARGVGLSLVTISAVLHSDDEGFNGATISRKLGLEQREVTSVLSAANYCRKNEDFALTPSEPSVSIG